MLFVHAILRVRDTLLRAIFAKALMSYTDFITGDFNLLCESGNLRPTTEAPILEGVVVEVLEDVVAAMNDSFGLDQNKITFNISSSTPPQDVFDTDHARFTNWQT